MSTAFSLLLLVRYQTERVYLRAFVLEALQQVVVRKPRNLHVLVSDEDAGLPLFRAQQAVEVGENI